MKTTLNINSNLQVVVEISEGNVFVQTITSYDKRSYFYNTVNEAIQNTCIVPLQKYLLSI
jgi:hypothetical protein